MRIQFVRSEHDRRLYIPDGDVWSRSHWLVRVSFNTSFFFSRGCLGSTPTAFALSVCASLLINSTDVRTLADPCVSLTVLTVALALGVVALCVQTVVSKSIVFVDSGRVVNVLYAYVGIFTGIYTTVLLLIRYGDISSHKSLHADTHVL